MWTIYVRIFVTSGKIYMVIDYYRINERSKEYYVWNNEGFKNVMYEIMGIIRQFHKNKSAYEYSRLFQKPQ